MTIAASTIKVIYSGNSSTTAFATTFKMKDSSHVKVIVTSSGGVETVQTETTNYVVTGVGSATGTVTMNIAPSTGETLTLLQNAPYSQLTDLVNGQSFNGDTIEDGLDLNTQLNQQTKEKLSRSLQAPESTAASFDGTLPALTAGYTLAINATATGFEAVAGGSGSGDLVDDLTPQLGGDLDVNGQSIVSASAGDVAITPDTTGDIVLDGLKWPQADGTADYVLKTDGAGQLSWTANTGSGSLANVVEDITPQLGGSLDVNGQSITSVSAGNIAITPDTTGDIVLDGLNWPQADGTANYVLETDGAGQLGWVANTGGSGLANIVEDTSPQLGGQLDVNGNAIGDGTNELITFTEDASAVNQVNIENEATGGGPIISAAGGDTNIDLNLQGKGTGNVVLQDAADTSKKLTVELSGATTAKVVTLIVSPTANRSVTVPDASDTLTGKATTDTLTNKTLAAGSGDTNTITNLPYDMGFIGGYQSDLTAADLVVQTYGELVMSRSGSILGEAGYLGTVATGAAVIVDIAKNGTTVYATKPQFAVSTSTLTAGTLKTDGTEDFVSGDRISFTVTQIGSTIAGAELRFTVKAEV